MSANLTGLIYVLVIFSGSLILIVLGYLLWLCYKKIKHRNNPIGVIEPFLNIEY
jgi:hypothetical protein